MKENAKLFLVSIITVIISITGSAVANTMLQANSISYKTSNGDTTDVNSALDRLFDVADINGRLGNTDISSIGDGTVTGAISTINNFDWKLLKSVTGSSKVSLVENANEYLVIATYINNRRMEITIPAVDIESTDKRLIQSYYQSYGGTFIYDMIVYYSTDGIYLATFLDGTNDVTSQTSVTIYYR